MTDVPRRYQERADELRQKARELAAQGERRRAQLYGQRALEQEELGRMSLRKEETRITVDGRRYRVSLSWNERGDKWSANAYRIGGRGIAGFVMPETFASGSSRDEALRLVRENLSTGGTS